MVIEQEITSALKALKINQRAEVQLRKHLLIQSHDNTADKFFRSVVAFPWDGRTEAVIAVAWWIAQMMTWEKGRLGYMNSASEIAAVSGIPLNTVKRAIATLIDKGFLTAPTRGPRQRGALLVAPDIEALQPGQCRTKHLSQRLMNVVNCLIGSGPSVGQISANLDHQWASLAHGWATYPSLSSPANKTHQQVGEQADQEGVKMASDDAGNLPSSNTHCPPTTSYTTCPPIKNNSQVAADAAAINQKRLEQPNAARKGIAGAGGRARDADATDAQGYPDEIEGLNGSTHELVARLAKLDGGITLNPDAAWRGLKRGMGKARAKCAGDVKVAAAMVIGTLSQMEAKTKKPDVPSRAFPSWCENADPAQYAKQLAAEEAKRASTKRHQIEQAKQRLRRAEAETKPRADEALEWEAQQDRSRWTDPNWLQRLREIDNQRVANAHAEVAHWTQVIESYR